MRPKTSDIDKLEDGIRVRLTKLEKRLLVNRSKGEGYRTVSDFCRAKLVRKRETRKIEVSEDFKNITRNLDFNLNKLSVNLNQLSKRVNSFAGYNISDADRELLHDIQEEIQYCFSVLQRYMDKIDSG
ncbi:MAG: hypothetical protein MI807_10200 [Verrucomicrobiales bacterium]|nr:hypothetical protein [Verrucomicrobiales bacterium]